MNVPVENLVIDGENANGHMDQCEPGDSGFKAPFAIFSPDLQVNVGGPYATRQHAEDALKAIHDERMIPYTYTGAVTWTINGKPSRWSEQDMTKLNMNIPETFIQEICNVSTRTPEKAKTYLEEIAKDIANKSPALRLACRFWNRNSVSKKLFQHVTGIELPKNNKDTDAFLKKYVGE